MGKNELAEPAIHTKARKVMGKNFLGIPEIEEYLGKISDHQKKMLEIIPFSNETVEACADTHILVADVGCKLGTIWNAHRELFDENTEDFFLRYSREIGLNNAFGTTSWQLVRKTADHTASYPQYREIFYSGVQDVPSVRLLVYVTVLHHLATGERLFQNTFVNTGSFLLCSDFPTVVMGFSDKDGLSVTELGDERIVHDLNLASAMVTWSPEDGEPVDLRDRWLDAP